MDGSTMFDIYSVVPILVKGDLELVLHFRLLKFHKCSKNKGKFKLHENREEGTESTGGSNIGRYL